MQVTTILGSCVAVCLWDMTKRIGGINHFMLPLHSGSGAAAPRFGNVAMKELLDGLRAAGARLPFLQARVFGGACMFAQMQSTTHLGQKNVSVALEFLAKNGVEVVQVDTGGNRGRKLIYRTDEGSVCLTTI
jgi:chemotaxis protein CheD